MSVVVHGVVSTGFTAEVVRSRSDLIIHAILTELGMRRMEIERLDGHGSVRIMVKLRDGIPRTITCGIETEWESRSG